MRRTLAWLLLSLLLVGCGQKMAEQPKYEPYEESTFFEDGLVLRQPLANTVAVDALQEDELLYQGSEEGQPATRFPFPITAEVLALGQTQYNVNCSPCHGLSGYGDGMIVQRGFPPPSSFHIDRLREAPPGYYFGVITNGFGVMFPYDYRVTPEERWAVIAYIRALQRSQNGTLEDVPAEERPALEAGQ